MKPLLALMLLATPAYAAPLSPTAAEGLCALAARGSLVMARAKSDVAGATEAMMFCIQSGLLATDAIEAASADFKAAAD